MGKKKAYAFLINGNEYYFFKWAFLLFMAFLSVTLSLFLIRKTHKFVILYFCYEL